MILVQFLFQTFSWCSQMKAHIWKYNPIIPPHTLWRTHSLPSPSPFPPSHHFPLLSPIPPAIPLCLSHFSLSLSFPLFLVSLLSPLPVSPPGSRVHDPAGLYGALSAAVLALTAAQPSSQAGVLERKRSGQWHPCAHLPPRLSPQDWSWCTFPGMNREKTLVLITISHTIVYDHYRNESDIPFKSLGSMLFLVTLYFKVQLSLLTNYERWFCLNKLLITAY